MLNIYTFYFVKKEKCLINILICYLISRKRKKKEKIKYKYSKIYDMIRIETWREMRSIGKMFRMKSDSCIIIL